MVRNNNLNSVILTNPDNNFNPYDAASPLPVTLSGGGGGGDATAANQVIGNTSLSTIDGKITACDTGSISGTVAVSAVSGDVDIRAATLPLPSGASSAINQVAGNSSLSSIATAVAGTLLVKQNEVLNEGSYANAANNVSIANGAYSSVVIIANINVCSIFYEDSSTSSFDSLKIEVSPDGTNYFDYGIELYPSQEGLVRKAVQTNLHVEGLTHLRLKNSSASDTYANVYGTVVGSP